MRTRSGGALVIVPVLLVSNSCALLFPPSVEIVEVGLVSSGVALQSLLTEGAVPYRVYGSVSVRGFGTNLDVPFCSEGILTP